MTERDRNYMMCRECGEFVTAVPDEEGLEPVPANCPSCGADEFTDIHDDQ